jgi:hypothetical protein
MNYPLVISVELFLVPFIAFFTWLQKGNTKERNEKRSVEKWIQFGLWILTLPFIVIEWCLNGKGSDILCEMRESGEVGIGSGGQVILIVILGLVGVHCAVGGG